MHTILWEIVNHCGTEQTFSSNVTELFKTLTNTLVLCHIIPGSQLEGTTYRHPAMGNRKQKLLQGNHVTVAKGTGLVHTAPAHGPEDFQVAINHPLPLVIHICLSQSCAFQCMSFYSKPEGVLQ